jgi:hypothetical protein
MAQARIKREVGVDTIAVVTRNDYDNISLCNEYGINYCTYRNEPLGSKWNRVLHEVRHTDCSHVIILGSDDIASSHAIKYQLDNVQYDMSGHADLWFYGLDKHHAGFQVFGYWISNTQPILGVGRMISREVIEANDWKLWDDELTSGLDRSCLDRVRSKTKNTYSYMLSDIGGFIMDVKFNNVSSMSPAMRTMSIEDPNITLPEFLSDDELDYFEWLYNHITKTFA